MKRILIGATGAALLATSAPGQIVETPIAPIETSAGLVAGHVLDSGVQAWFGVPFAAPPLRDLRWQPPQAHEPWQGVWNADRFAPECMQTLRNSDINHYFGEEALSEDCLYLNIWAPSDAAPGDDLPVVAWIYGGGFNVGSASMDNYQGEALAQEGVVYVSIAYRLGAMGFMAHPDLAAESDYGGSGNYGLMDQAFGLQWVADNIAAFGGDPDNVLITGQSAGSMSLSALQVSPLAEGLIDKIFAMSGSVINQYTRPYEAMEEAGLAAQEQLGAESLADLRAISSDRFLDLEDVRFGLTIDGRALTEDPADAYAAGRFADVPLVGGYTRDEGFNALAGATSAEDFIARAEEQWPGTGEALAEVYAPGEGNDLRRSSVDAARDASMGSAMRDWALAQVEYGDSPVWLYRFDRTQPYSPGVTFADHDPATAGAYHTVEVPYFLRTLDSLNMFRTTRDWGPQDEALRDDASGALLSLAREGTATGNGLDWPEFTAEDQQILIFDVGTPEAREIPFREGFDIIRDARITQ
ncbi:carboxylesterase [Salipiger sp. IMCC34102]|uniref:carboxylesterase/lipase family protein n=1 Tax=Salipiger sp. IMCC34102 TaxID=2510647 RepID=UPI00101D315A|nr:carboxylesterase family protein [Salipiger sp. IMCC34102]RYH04456.1 carboxylesterase [Salipiger sp. IMCC34102]